tara:strand:- start:2036 stop:2689 length:654 start_codon:yes stop_codon:yes gene_type:complete
MGQNSTEVAYGFGQMGSAFTDVAKPIVPPQGMVIIAIQFLADSTPTVLLPEKLDTDGPGFPQITGTTDAVVAADPWMNFNGVTSAACDTAITYAAGTDVSISASNSKIQVGQYVLLVDDADTEAVGLDIDAETPVPIYSGPNQRGVKVTGIAANGDPQLSAQITPTTIQSLIFLDAQHGAGAVEATGVVYPKGVVIYGRWTTFTGEAAKPVICYFGQ